MRTFLLIHIFLICSCIESSSSEYAQQQDCESLISKATDLTKTNRYKDAIKLLEKAKNNGCSNSILHVNLGDAYFKIEAVDKAVKEFEAAMKFEENLELIHANLGICYSILGRNGEATDNFLQAIKLDSENADNYYYLATHQQMNGNLEGALMNINKAFMLDPNNTIFLIKRAGILGDMEQFESALNSLNIALSMKPSTEETIDLFWMKTMCFLELSNSDSACSNLQRLKALDPYTDYSEIEIECK